MKRLRYLTAFMAATAVVSLVGCSARNDNGAGEQLTNTADHVEILYFHGNMRCVTCKAIEENVKVTVDSILSGDDRSDKLILRVINIADDEAMADRYRTTGSSLFVTTVVNGVEARKDMTEFAFRTARKHSQMFKDSLATVVQQSLNSIEP